MKISLFILLFSSSLFARTSLDLTTHAEKTGWKETGRAEETARLCQSFQKQFPKRVQCKTFGKTPEGRDLYYMIVGDLKSPVVWVQAGIHAGEIDGKDAVFLLLKEILTNKMSPDPLKGICLVFVPIFNLDGHERVGKWNRPNQVGPEEMGWRTTSQNYNLNRDFVKVDAPEMRDLLKLWHKTNPVLSLDLHVTNGAQFQPEVGLIIHPTDLHGSSALHQFGSEFEKNMIEKMVNRGRKALPFYPSFENYEDPSSGFGRYVSTAKYAHGYWFNNNRLGMLVETHSWKDYANRVKSHHDTVLSSLELTQIHGLKWRDAQKLLDEQNYAGTDVDLEFKHTDKSREIEFGGYKYSIEKSEVSGAKVIKYDPSKPEIWKIPYFEELKASLTVTAPEEGYFIQAADAEWLLPKLTVHNVKFSKWTKAAPQNLKVFRASKTKFSNVSFEGHQTLVVDGEWKKEDVTLPKDFYFVPINQPKGKLILQMLEPQAQDSFLSWGFFNKAFEQKEYMENYVAEDVAIEMMKNPEIKKEFEALLKNDQEFKNNPALRFQFFYKKHPSWDERFNKYPVYKL